MGIEVQTGIMYALQLLSLIRYRSIVPRPRLNMFHSTFNQSVITVTTRSSCCVSMSDFSIVSKSSTNYRPTKQQPSSDLNKH